MLRFGEARGGELSATSFSGTTPACVKDKDVHNLSCLLCSIFPAYGLCCSTCVSASCKRTAVVQQCSTPSLNIYPIEHYSSSSIHESTWYKYIDRYSSVRGREREKESAERALHEEEKSVKAVGSEKFHEREDGKEIGEGRWEGNSYYTMAVLYLNMNKWRGEKGATTVQYNIHIIRTYRYVRVFSSNDKKPELAVTAVCTRIGTKRNNNWNISQITF